MVWPPVLSGSAAKIMTAYTTGWNSAALQVQYVVLVVWADKHCTNTQFMMSRQNVLLSEADMG